MTQNKSPLSFCNKICKAALQQRVLQNTAYDVYTTSVQCFIQKMYNINVF